MRTSLRGLLTAAVLACCCAIGAAPAAAQQSTADQGTSTSTSAPAPTSLSDTATVKLTRGQTKSVQRRVRVRPDGAIGARTRAAIRRYQRRESLKRTGRPNLETLRAMKLKFAERIAARAERSASTPAPAPAAGSAATVVQAARDAIGTPYGSAGNGPDSYDCSGLTVMAFAKAGIELPRTSFDQYEQGAAVERAAIAPGDLVFFDAAGPGASHVGVATSATTVISATTRGVMEHQIGDSYWGERYVGARRLAG